MSDGRCQKKCWHFQTRTCLAFRIELLLAFVDGDKMGFCGIPSFVNRQLDFARLHLLVVEHFGGIHALDVMLDLRGIRGRDTDVPTELLLLLELTGKLRDVAREVPLNMKGLGGLLFLRVVMMHHSVRRCWTIVLIVWPL